MKRITILIADDDAEIAGLVALHLEKEGYHTVKVTDGKAAVQAVQSRHIDLAVLDIMMPGLDGHEVTRQIREQHQLPIIFLSAKTSDLDKITGLVIGADDYMTKPFNPMELVARVNAQLRRFMQLNQPQAERRPVLESGGLVIDPDRRTVELFGTNVELTPKEFDICTCWPAIRRRCSARRICSSRCGARLILRAEIPLWFTSARCAKSLARSRTRTN